MGKGKPRHNPDKRANQRGGWCSHCEEISGLLRCMYEGTRFTKDELLDILAGKEVVGMDSDGIRQVYI